MRVPPAALLTLVVLALPAHAAARQAPAGLETGTIRVAGRATVTAPPDRAVIDLTVSARASTSREAVTTNAREVEKTLAALKGMGEGLTVETAGYAVTPEYERGDDRGRPRVAGYRAATVLRATTADLGRAGEIVDTATRAGANEVGGVRFILRDEQAVRARALRQAAADARGQAEALASALGVRLARLVSATTEGEPPVRPMQEVRALMADAGAPAPPLPPGSIEVEASVVLTFAIAQ